MVSFGSPLLSVRPSNQPVCLWRPFLSRPVPQSRNTPRNALAVWQIPNLPVISPTATQACDCGGRRRPLRMLHNVIATNRWCPRVPPSSLGLPTPVMTLIISAFKNLLEWLEWFDALHSTIHGPIKPRCSPRSDRTSRTA